MSGSNSEQVKEVFPADQSPRVYAKAYYEHSGSASLWGSCAREFQKAFARPSRIPKPSLQRYVSMNEIPYDLCQVYQALMKRTDIFGCNNSIYFYKTIK